MATPDNEQKAGAEKKAGSPILRLVLVGGFAVVIPALIALLLVNFVLAPMMAQPSDDATVEASAGGGMEVIPAEVVAVEFAEEQATVLVEDPSLQQPLLNYKVTFVCANQETADVVQERQSYFIAMLGKLHRGRTRNELNDPAMEDTIRRQAKQEANLLLQRLTGGDSEMQVLEVQHLKFTMLDL